MIMLSGRHDWKNVDLDVKNQTKQIDHGVIWG